MSGTFYSKRLPHRMAVSNRTRPKRPKTFVSEEAAQTWAESQGLKKFSLVNIRSEASVRKKIKVVLE